METVLSRLSLLSYLIKLPVEASTQKPPKIYHTFLAVRAFNLSFSSANFLAVGYFLTVSNLNLCT
jgi:hypothetical protein